MDRSLTKVLLAVFAGLGLCFLASSLAGCSTLHTEHPGWHPESKEEMRQLIGQTVMDAAHQYNRQLHEARKKAMKNGGKLRLNPGPVNERTN
jgi:hypothetical protein